MESPKDLAHLYRELLLQTYPTTVHPNDNGFTTQTVFANYCWVQTSFQESLSETSPKQAYLDIQFNGSVEATFQMSQDLASYLLIELPQRINEQIFCVRRDESSSVAVYLYAQWKILDLKTEYSRPEIFIDIFDSFASSLGILQRELFERF